jgi:hypothetical protein
MSMPDLPLQGTELQTNQSDPVPLLRTADVPDAPDLRRPAVAPLSPLGKRLQVLLRVHEAAYRAYVWAWIWWGIRALVVLGVAIPLCIGIGHATFAYVYDPPSRHLHTDQTIRGIEYFIKGEKVERAAYEYARNSDYRVHHQAEIAAVAAGIGAAAILALIWTLFEWCWRRKFAPLEEQIAGIQRDHASEVTAWGGPSVLREPGAVAEILRLETAR